MYNLFISTLFHPACLEFFCEHASLFGTQIERDYSGWFTAVEHFALHPNKQDSKNGCNALVSLLAESTRQLSTRPNSLKSSILEVPSFGVIIDNNHTCN